MTLVQMKLQVEQMNVNEYQKTSFDKQGIINFVFLSVSEKPPMFSEMKTKEYYQLLTWVQ